MQVVRGKDWKGQDINGTGILKQKTYGSFTCNRCSIQRDHTSLNGCNDISPLWVTVKWPDDRFYCHRIGTDEQYDLYHHIGGIFTN